MLFLSPLFLIIAICATFLATKNDWKKLDLSLKILVLAIDLIAPIFIGFVTSSM